ncbi:hypothetical protein ZIOFF_068461 [Zingiber officinale]|uniref:Protein kinase domain-containing protein n=1 Tax=Zingiber officinale TaxID=94328 RepID=A0A8J5CHC6_ZINOF|nr:hypothetical protein ZIOFF_068461 [Zingiber officinale]
MSKIQTHGREKPENGICHDDSTPPVKAKTINELHSLQKKRSAPTTPIKDDAQQGNAAFATISEEERQKLQLQSIRLVKHTNHSLGAYQINYRMESETSKSKVKRHVGKYELGRTIGEGTFAKVRFAKNIETGEPVAIKIFDKEKVLKHKLVEQNSNQLQFEAQLQSQKSNSQHQLQKTTKQYNTSAILVISFESRMYCNFL